MKKRTMAFGGLLMAVAMTAYSVSGTYAKYTSKVDLTDEARVAKWEFKATDEKGNAISDNKINLFADSYYLDDATKLYVDSSNTDKVVAPGTTGTYAFKLSGNMEVRYGLTFNIDTEKDFIVYYTKNADNTVKDMATAATKAELETKAEAAGDTIYKYRPIRYTVKYTRGTDATDLTKGLITNVTLDELLTKLNAYSAAHPEGFAPKAMDQNYEIKWVWDTETEIKDLAAGQVDVLDTFAGENLSKDTIKLGITITATQIAEDYSSVNGRVNK